VRQVNANTERGIAPGSPSLDVATASVIHLLKGCRLLFSEENARFTATAPTAPADSLPLAGNVTNCVMKGGPD
jgi:hypothetical protein